MLIMKKMMSVFVALCLCVASYATNTWNQPFGKSAFSDPYVNNYYSAVTGSPGYPDYKLTVVADFNQTVGVPYYVILQVYGVWSGIGVGYKQFTLLYSGAQWHKSLTYNMSGTEEAYTETTELVDYGLQ